jgi:hypothetical protein
VHAAKKSNARRISAFVKHWALGDLLREKTHLLHVSYRSKFGNASVESMISGGRFSVR